MKKVLLVSWVIMIFYFSSTSAIKVTDPSTWMNQTVYSTHVSLTDILDSDSQFYLGYLENHHTYFDLGLEFYLRKLAHILVYSMLSLFILLNLQRFRMRYTIAWLFTVSIAFVDEANQFMMEGRSGRLLDVTLDSTAAFILLSFVWLLSLLLQNTKRRKI